MMAKAKSKKQQAAIALSPPSGEDEQRASVSVRKIKNGFISERSGHLKDDPYKSEEMYHPTKPKIQMNVGDDMDVQGDQPTPPSGTPKAKSALKQRMSKVTL